MTDIDFNLPSLRELRAYYAALPDDWHFPADYDEYSCLLAIPVNECSTGDRIAIRPAGEPLDAEVELETQTGTTIVCDRLDEDYNALACEFDRRMDPEHPLTYGECVALINEFIAKYPEA